MRATEDDRAIRETNPVESYSTSRRKSVSWNRRCPTRGGVGTAEARARTAGGDQSDHGASADVGRGASTCGKARRARRGAGDRSGLVVAMAAGARRPGRSDGYVLQVQRDSASRFTGEVPIGVRGQATHNGRIMEVCQTANRPTEKASRQSPTILTKVSLNEPELEVELGEKVRPGMRRGSDCVRAAAGGLCVVARYLGYGGGVVAVLGGRDLSVES